MSSSDLIEKQPLDILVEKLKEEFKNPQPEGFTGNGEVITQLLSQYVNNHNDWKEYVFYCPYSYSRNLIAKTELFELMVICWRRGQPSPIHNHENQRCWMGCVKGQLEETYYVFRDTKCTRGKGLLEQSYTHPIDNGSVGYITDEIAFHRMQSIAEETISIHLYSKPITECNIYCPEKGTITRKRLGYFTQYKKKCNLAVNPDCQPPQTNTPIVSDCSSSSTTTSSQPVFLKY
ncbi:hypothetical protein DICPUDRAFT_154741 [Dictyostelium purpureum]|uniref:Cysteine dioxygenase n=1 Tax=Dictyostelium purpureum TaxID=5786 RepID=F0ZS51_DICPU|nr:uncharacterized protein DICPUDRAFT_154741 [Dictyostelium purpureum]EGC33252.1 hypothetical protein DICPUDRAFT_154741 [Dictyostelium purpureum]|eukprot:XP_003290245.1 hypothetical protein DICPUDRAFT_154741 [Dictyostelium purpureum]